MQKTSALDAAHELISSLSSVEDAKSTISELEKLPPAELNNKLEELYGTAEELAIDGKVKDISVIIRVFDHFGDRSHDRMLLHYFAQAEANHSLKQLNQEARTDEQHKQVTKAMEIISEAFKEADEINDQAGVK